MKNNITESVKKLYSCVSQGLGGRIIPLEVKKVLGEEYTQIEVEGGIELYPEVIGDETSVSQYQDLYKNTCSRLIYQEMKKQRNIEEIVSKTETILEEHSSVSDEKVEEDWLTRFFNSVQDISSEQMQTLWSRILAGEIIKPNSFSLRCLDAMTKMSTAEANLFETLCQYVINYRGTLAILNNDKINQKYGIRYENILRLSECGVIDSSTMMSITIKVNNDNNYQTVYGNYFLLGKAQENEQKITVQIYKMTSIGMELYSIQNKKYNYDYFRDVEVHLAKINRKIKFTEHKIIQKLENDKFRYLKQGRVILGNEELNT